MKKRVLSLLLAALMVLCVIPAFSLVSFAANTRETAEDYKNALGITSTDDDRAHFIALIDAYGYDGMPTAKTIKEKLDGYKKFDAEYTNEEIASKLSYSVAQYFLMDNATLKARILAVLESDPTLGTKDMATKIAKDLATDDIFSSQKLSDQINSWLSVRNLELYNYNKHASRLTAEYHWLDGTTTIVSALQSNRYKVIDALVDQLVTNGITKTHDDKTAYTDTDQMKADMKADLYDLCTTYTVTEQDVTVKKNVADLVADNILAKNPVTADGSEVTKDMLLNAINQSLSVYPILVNNEAAAGMAYYITEAGVCLPNDTTTASTNNVKIPYFFNIWDDLAALRNKTNYGSRRIDEFYKNFADIAIVTEDGAEKDAAAAQFKAYLDYYFTAGAGNYGYYEDLWYDDGHLVSFVDFANLDKAYSVAHYTAKAGTAKATGINMHFSRFLDGSVYYNTDGTETVNTTVLRYTWAQADRSYMKVIGGQNIGNYYMLGTGSNNQDATKTQIGVSPDGRLTLVKDETGRYDFNIFTQLYFSDADILIRDKNGLQNPENEGNNSLQYYTPNMWVDNSIYDGTDFGGYTIESIFAFNNYHKNKPTDNNANSNSYNNIAGIVVSQNRISTGIVSIRVMTKDKVNYYTNYFGIGNNADAKFASILSGSEIYFDNSTFRMSLSGSFDELKTKRYDPNLSINGFKANGTGAVAYYAPIAIPTYNDGFTAYPLGGTSIATFGSYNTFSALITGASVMLNDRDYYALRYYDVELTDLQKQRNQFADLCYYYGIEITDTVKAIIKADADSVYNTLLSRAFDIRDGRGAEFASAIADMTEALWYAENIAPLYKGTSDLFAEIDFTAINSSNVGAIEDSAREYIRMIEPRGDDQIAMLNSGNVSKGNTYPQRDENGNVVTDKSGNIVYVTNPYNGYHYYVRISDGKMKGYYYMLMAAASLSESEEKTSTKDNPAVDKTLVTSPTALKNYATQNFYTPEQRAAADFVHPFLNEDGTFKMGTKNVYLSTGYIYTAAQVRDTGRGTGAGQPMYHYWANSHTAGTSLGHNTGTGYTVQYVAAYKAIETNTQVVATILDAPQANRSSGKFYFQFASNIYWNRPYTKPAETQFPLGVAMDLAVVGTFNNTQSNIISYLDGAQLGTWSDNTITPYSKTINQETGWYNGNVNIGGFVPYYLRIYERDLTADELANNHFVDLCRYYHVDTDLFVNADAEKQQNIINAFKYVTIDNTGVNAQFIKDTITFEAFGLDKAELEQALIFAGFQARTNTNIGLRSVFVLNEDVLTSLGSSVVAYGAMVGNYVDGDTFDSFTVTYDGTGVVYNNATGVYSKDAGFKTFQNESEKNDILTEKGMVEGNYNVFALTTDFIKDATIKEVLEGTASVSGDFNQKLMYRAFIIITDGNGNYYTYYINAASDNYTENNGALSMYDVAKYYEAGFGSYDCVKYVLDNSGN
ncbi:MAG: hypothetical protein SOZ62_00010 [Eubacteriales bacterium]|nr:hypothetical protein [Eubacteriales bacterium]